MIGVGGVPFEGGDEECGKSGEEGSSGAACGGRDGEDGVCLGAVLLRDYGGDAGLFELHHAAPMCAAGGVGAEESADGQEPEIVGEDEDDPGGGGDEHVSDGPRAGRDDAAGEHHGGGEKEAAGEGCSEDDADLGVCDADVGEVDYGEDRQEGAGGVADEASGVEEVGVEGGAQGSDDGRSH